MTYRFGRGRANPALLRRPSGVAVGGGPLFAMSELTGSRSSEAAYFDPRTNTFVATGAGAWLPDDELRILDDGAALFEESRTNLCTDSIGSTWSGTGTVQVSSLAAPDGGVAYECVDDNAANVEYVQKTFPDSGSTGDHVVSLFIERTASFSAFPEIYFSGSTAVLSGGVARVRIDPSDGSHHVFAGTPTSVTVEAAGDDWWRVSFVVNVTTSGSVLFRFYSAISSTLSGAGQASQLDTRAFWGAQVEAGSFPTSPIRTSGASATRAAEYGTLPSASVPAEIETGAWSITTWPLLSSAEISTIGSASDIPIARGAGNYWQWLNIGTIRVLADSVGEASFSGFTFDRLQALTWTLDMPGGTASLEGATTGDASKALTSGASAGPFGAGNDLTVGRLNVPNPFNGVISPPVAA